MRTSKRRATSFAVVFLPDWLLQNTGRLLASFAEHRPSEGIVYWFGIEHDSCAIVTTLVVPDADTTAGSVRTSALANAEAQKSIVGTPLVLLGQAHTHAGSHTAHSIVDDTETFARFDGALSLVVSYYARYGVNLDECSVYRHIEGAFRMVPAGDLERHLRVLPSACDYRKARWSEEHPHGF